ncbi:hypothetical protein PN498_05445 [Oscillatoria sp. CS-180]|uniref:hypothetical protein n=1 Tax=Oscillatoria sp. CS-180 TaxID=3021720 RepID=UPI00232F5671|nr:hypothetical protein [Oscillatoria sp. CS-180]MDB9525422.1 hypothetical protein [Oscillatoria sp. CS-180]
MLWTILLSFGIAIVARGFMRTCTSHSGQLLGILIAAVLLTFILADAPVLIKSLMLLWLLVEPGVLQQSRTS